MAAEPDDPKVLARLSDEGKADVTALRDNAEKWRNGIAAVAGIVSAGLVFKAPDPVVGASVGWRIALFAVVALAVLSGIAATYCAIRASAGIPTTVRAPVTIDETLAHYEARGKAIRRHLRRAVALAAAMIVLLLASVALAWFLPRQEAKVARVESVDGRVVCGRLLVLDDVEVVVSVFGHPISVPRDRVRSLGEAQACG